MKGYVHVYTGNGKGKTTAALGLAIRAAGAGLRVYIAQFLKNFPYSEIKALERFRNCITVQQYGTGCFIINHPSEADHAAARKGFEDCVEQVISGNFDVVILDEITIAISYGMIAVDELLALIDRKPEHVELVITGRYADEKLIGRADVVTEMKEIKHYYARGVCARDGIEK
ncbi:MAG: cob(I)yrinic acid a,c-diamide adenosyltransferase [Desulfobacterota bacterium]|nr:cob(I)yrinic acid a,c-diamide adenosyltransferase [Thermodesulfobacteriota bacterium]